MQVLALFVLLAGHVAADLPTTAIAAAKQALVEDIDPTLSSNTAFEEWLEDLAGPSVEIAWEANDCGEQTGDPAIDAGRDIPLCVEARVAFPDRRTLSLSIMVGTWRSGVEGAPRFRFGILDTGTGRTIHIDSLAQAPVVLAGNTPVRAGSTLSTPASSRHRESGPGAFGGRSPDRHHRTGHPTCAGGVPRCRGAGAVSVARLRKACPWGAAVAFSPGAPT